MGRSQKKVIGASRENGTVNGKFSAFLAWIKTEFLKLIGVKRASWVWNTHGKVLYGSEWPFSIPSPSTQRIKLIGGLGITLYGALRYNSKRNEFAILIELIIRCSLQQFFSCSFNDDIGEIVAISCFIAQKFVIGQSEAVTIWVTDLIWLRYRSWVREVPNRTFWYDSASYQAHLVTPWTVWLDYIFPNLQTMARPVSPDIPSKREKKVRWGVKARLHRLILSQQLYAIFVATSNRLCKPGAIFSVICRRDIAGVSNTFARQKLHRVVATKIACVNGP